MATAAEKLAEALGLTGVQDLAFIEQAIAEAGLVSAVASDPLATIRSEMGKSANNTTVWAAIQDVGIGVTVDGKDWAP